MYVSPEPQAEGRLAVASAPPLTRIHHGPGDMQCVLTRNQTNKSTSPLSRSMVRSAQKCCRSAQVGCVRCVVLLHCGGLEW